MYLSFICRSVLIILCSLAIFTRPATGTESTVESTSSISAYKLINETIRLDGVLSESVWQMAESGTDFRVWSPNRGGMPAEQTRFAVAYDEEAIYFGVMAYESDASQISTKLNRRDDTEDTDIIGIYLDTYHDKTTAFNFMTSAPGFQADRYVYGDGDMDIEWNAVWEVETAIVDSGWTAEFRIPFSAVRFRQSQSMTWGVNVYRFTHARSEDTAWLVWDRETRGFVSRFGELEGIDGIIPKKQIEVLPYIAHSTANNSDLGEGELEHYSNLGADLKYPLTSDLLLQATIQPDFGQVEADPAVLNLSPFETQFTEKRSFFTEGAQYFWHPEFIQFYSRRIGTGNANSRIRAAGKLIGKTTTGVSIASLYAMTDVTGRGQSHNFLKSGDLQSHYIFTRVSKEFAGGTNSIGFSQSAVIKPDERDIFSDYATRDGYTTGADIDLNFLDKDYNVNATFIGSVVDPAPIDSLPTLDHSPRYGTGGTLSLRKLGGLVKGGVWGQLESDKLDINDFGFISASDEVYLGGWAEFKPDIQGQTSLFRDANYEASIQRSWLYAPGTGYDHDTDALVWEYSAGHPQKTEYNVEYWLQLRNFWATWAGFGGDFDGTLKYETRSFNGRQGPLITDPETFWWWIGVDTNPHRSLEFDVNFNPWFNDAGGSGFEFKPKVRWRATSTQSYYLEFVYKDDFVREQFIANFANPGSSIGGVSYVFGNLDQRTLDLTIRGDILFTRYLSLQLYAQPYLTVGDYANPVELVRPDSYEFRELQSIPDFDATQVDEYDFRYSALNFNAVLRWEYELGSTIYLVWKHGRDLYLEDRVSTAVDLGDLFENQPVNTILLKATHRFEI
ncbi:DUF5916 domain-containing protein [Calditrichota bacterium]